MWRCGAEGKVVCILQTSEAGLPTKIAIYIHTYLHMQGSAYQPHT